MGPIEMINQKAIRMSPDEKMLQFLDALLPDAESMRFVESQSPCVADADIGMPSLRVLKAPVDGKLAYLTIKSASPLATMADPALLRILYRSLRDDALASDPDALNDLGWLWINGRGVPFDSALARRLFKLAYVLGSGEAAFNLGEQAWYGRSVRINHDLAASYYEQACERGVMCAAQVLGRLHEKGVDGEAPDFAKATHWYRLAAGAAFALGEKYYGF